jgi:hypothetical protein
MVYNFSCFVMFQLCIPQHVMFFINKWAAYRRFLVVDDFLVFYWKLWFLSRDWNWGVEMSLIFLIFFLIGSWFPLISDREFFVTFKDMFIHKCAKLKYLFNSCANQLKFHAQWAIFRKKLKKQIFWYFPAITAIRAFKSQKFDQNQFYRPQISRNRHPYCYSSEFLKKVP